MNSNVKINFLLDYGAEKAQYETVIKQKEFLKTAFSSAVNTTYRNGVSKEQLRRFHDISKKVDEAEAVEISFTTYELKFLKECFEKATWHPGAHNLVCQIFNILDNKE